MKQNEEVLYGYSFFLAAFASEDTKKLDGQSFPDNNLIMQERVKRCVSYGSNVHHKEADATHEINATKKESVTVRIMIRQEASSTYQN